MILMNLILSLFFIPLICRGNPNPDINEVFKLISSQPLEQQNKEYKENIKDIENSLVNGRKPGLATYGTTSLLAKSLGVENDFESHIENWFRDYANVDYCLTDYIYDLKKSEEWIELFRQAYPKLSNPEVLYRIRFYAFSEHFVLPQTPPSPSKPKYEGLEIQLLPTGSGNFSDFELKITNTSKYDTFVFPQTKTVATSWKRKDGVLLPNKTALTYAAERKMGLVFLFPGDSLCRQFKLRPVERDRTYYRAGDAIFLKNKHRFTCINGVYLAVDQEAPLVEMKAYLVPFSPSKAEALESDLRSKYGHRVDQIHLIKEPLFSNAIDLQVKQGKILNLKTK